MVIMYECWFLGCNKYTTLVGNVDNEEDCACVCQWAGVGDSRGGRTWQISLSSCQFCCEPKTALKHLSLWHYVGDARWFQSPVPPGSGLVSGDRQLCSGSAPSLLLHLGQVTPLLWAAVSFIPSGVFLGTLELPGSCGLSFHSLRCSGSS